MGLPPVVGRAGRRPLPYLLVPLYRFVNPDVVAMGDRRACRGRLRADRPHGVGAAGHGHRLGAQFRHARI